MASLCDDQAAGLRKLFAGARGPATVAFAGPAARGPLLAGVARGLAAAGKEVLVIDERAGGDGVAAAFGLRSRFDFLQAVSGDVPAAQVLLRPEPAIRLLPAARAARRHGRLDAMARRSLAEWLRRLQREADFVLADMAEGAGEDGSPLLPQPQRVVVALSPEAAAITAAYARIKRLAQAGARRRFGIVVLGAGSAEEARTVFVNLREVARRHLDVELERLGAAVACGDADGLGEALAAGLLDAARAVVSADPASAAQGRPGAAAACPVV